MAREKKQKKSDKKCNELLIYELGPGSWSEVKEDESDAFRFDGELGPLPFWVLEKNPGRCFKESDLKALCKQRISLKGQLWTLENFGPWDVAREQRGPLCVSFDQWRWSAMEIQRAYFLWRDLRRGEVPEWQIRKSGTLPLLQIISWPRHLRMKDEPKAWTLSLAGPMARRWSDWEDIHTARALAKVLLAQYIDAGLKGLKHSFSFDPDRDSFRFDPAEKGALSLRVACWLILRDLAAGLTGIRFCQAPGCKREIPRDRNSGAKTCGGRGSACQKAHWRHQQDIKRASNGQT